MSIWTWWMPEKKEIDKIVDTQDDEDVPEREICVRKSKVNHFYKRKHLRNKHITNYDNK